VRCREIFSRLWCPDELGTTHFPVTVYLSIFLKEIVASVNVQNVQSSACTPPYIFMAWYLIKHREIFAYTFSFTSPITCTLLPSSVVVGAYQHRCLPPTYKTTLCHNMEDHSMNPNHHEHLKFYVVFHFLRIIKLLLRISVSWDVMLYCWVSGCWCFEEFSMVHLTLQNDSHTFLWNVRNIPPKHAASHPGRLEFSFTLLWKPHNLQISTVHFEMRLLGV
jgi:hypothetical protein